MQAAFETRNKSSCDSVETAETQLGRNQTLRIRKRQIRKIRTRNISKLENWQSRDDIHEFLLVLQAGHTLKSV